MQIQQFDGMAERKQDTNFDHLLGAVDSRNLDSPVSEDADYNKPASKYGEARILKAVDSTAAGRPYPINRGELKNLRSEPDSYSITEMEPAPADVDYPEYLVWKGFAQGAKATCAFRGLWQANPRNNQLTASKPSVHQIYLLQSVDAGQAKLWLTEVAYDYPDGRTHPPGDTEIVYPAKIPPPRISAVSPIEFRQRVVDFRRQESGYTMGGGPLLRALLYGNRHLLEERRSAGRARQPYGKRHLFQDADSSRNNSRVLSRRQV